MRDLQVTREWNDNLYRVRRLTAERGWTMQLVLLDVERSEDGALTLWRWLEHQNAWQHTGPIIEPQLYLLFHPAVPLNVFFEALYEYPKLPEECQKLIDRIDWSGQFTADH